MATFPGPANAIVYAQFNLQGRWKRMLIVAGAYSLFMIGAIWLTTLGETNFHPRDLEGWVGGITALQVLNLLVFGSFRVESAVRGDVTSRMIESHRLMPATPLAAILGYLIGAPLQAYLIAIANFVLGAVCCSIAGLSLDTWALLNAAVLCTAFCGYSLIAQFSFLARGGFLILLIGGFAAVTAASSGGLLMIPSANVLLSPMLSRFSVFAELFGGGRGGFNSGDLGLAYLTAAVGQAIILIFGLCVAMRRYQSSSIVGVSALLGLVLLGVWVGLSVADFSSPDTFQSLRSFGYQSQDLPAETVSAFTTSLLLAMLPIASAARTAVQNNRFGDPDAPSKSIRFSPSITLLCAAVIVCVPVLNAPGIRASYTSDAWLTVAILINFLLSITALFCWAYMQRRRAWMYAIIWTVLTWIGPLIADAVYRTATDSNANATGITAISPAGALALIWSHSAVVVPAGMIGQVILSVLPCGLYMLARKRTGRVVNRETIQPA